MRRERITEPLERLLKPCPECEGRGRVWAWYGARTCKACSGTGVEQEESMAGVKNPAEQKKEAEGKVEKKGGPSLKEKEQQKKDK
jgi:DnaJ-class molecular chaperone